MIQRIQSLYQFTGLVILVLGLFLPWSKYSFAGGEYKLTGISTSVVEGSATLLTMSIVTGILLIAAMLVLFNRRSLQQKLGIVSMVQMIMIFAAFAWVHGQAIDLVKAQAKEFELSYGFGVVTPLVCSVLIWMAKRAIKKDEDLVKSIDRLR